MRVCLRPFYESHDDGSGGGIRRVVEAQERYLPEFDIEVVRDIQRADLVAVHAGEHLQTQLPVVEHCHGLYWNEYDWEAAWFYQLNRVVIDTMLRADYVTAPSNWVANIIRRGAWINPRVLYHGIDLDDWPKQKQQNANYILWNKTRIDPICDPEPVNTLSLRNPDLQFATTYGDKRDNVTVLGLQPYELAKQVVQHAALYLCTTRETFGIGTLEAMASGVPVIGWAWGGQREFIVNGVHGYLAQPGNYEELEYGIQQCLQHRSEMAIACRTLVEDRFTWRKAIKRYAKLYAEVLAPKPAHPKVSVIITNYKLEHYLNDAIDSVLTQENFSASQLQIIIVNDASPTWDMDEFRKRYINVECLEVIHNAKNQYLAGALNTGIAAATGDYIVCLDADNLLGPRALATLATALDNDRTLDIVYGAMALYDTGAVSGWPGEFNYRQQITHHNQIPSTCMYRKRVWERSGGYRERCRTAEDADFWCRVTSLGFKPQKVTDAVTLIYRDRDDSMSRVEHDWPWNEWYTWNRYNKLMPFVAPQQADRDIKVPTYEPVKVSVVIPVGPGHEHLVVDAVDSLVAQTFQNWECIVVNDTGTPLPWIHPFVKVVNISDEMEPVINRVSRARNLGISLSTAKYFVLLDADDYLQPSALMKMYDAITHAESGTGYAYTDWYVAETKERHSTPNYSCATVLERFNHAVTCIYDKAAWQSVGGFDQQLHGWEDWDFIIALNVAGYCGIRVPYPLLQYRIGGGKRREELYAWLEENKAEMRAKWHEYIDGSKKMACGCQNGSGVSASRQAGDGAFNSSGEDMVQLEYVGDMLGPLNYIGKVTGNRYLFGTEPEHTVKYVMKDDVPALLTVEGFRYYDEGNNEPVLEALGPPVREEVGELALSNA